MKWIKIEDQMPPDEDTLLLFDGSEIFLGKFIDQYEAMSLFGIKKEDGIYYGWYQKNKITHWMPLPNPPNGEQ